MTKRSPISAIKNIYYDAQEVDNSDLTLEQDYNDTIESSIINNHIGTGILPEALVQNILFDSALTTGFLDGYAVSAQNQPVDNNFGNQLEIGLKNSKAAGRKCVKIAIIGLDFQSNLQYETFYFRRNEAQVSTKHFTKILTILFNDFIGDPDLSFNLGGHLVIKEAKPLTLSRDPIMVAQDLQPNLFFRDFFVDGGGTLTTLLQQALPLYNIDSLNITTTELNSKVILSNDVTTQIGEKFLATTNNIQKVSLLLSVRNLVLGSETDLVWNGDLVVSIYPLQSDITCASDIAPNLPIDFSPSNIPVAQISINYASLEESGVILDSVPQPVDFVFSNSPIAAGNVLIPGAYYALSIKRSGAANKCDIITAVGSNLAPDSRITVFTGSLWVDLPEEQLWFKIWTDSAKVSDGQAYESGHGIILPKTNLDEISQATIDYSKNAIQFTGNDVFRAVVSATTEKSVSVPDQRTGNPIDSRQQFVPSINLLNTIDITNLENASEPLIIGAITDRNRKFFDSISSLINSKLYSATFVDNELLIKIITDTTDGYRFDPDVVSLQTNLLLGDFEGAKIYPNANDSTKFYRVSSASLCSMLLGDVNGDGVITSEDLDLLTTFVGYDLTTGLSLSSNVTTDGYTTTYVNGYNSSILPFTNTLVPVSFQLVDPITHVVVAASSGSDGILVVNPDDPTQAQFTSGSVTFNNIIGLSSYKLVINAPSITADYGGFDIISVDSITDALTIRKILLSGEVISQMLRADIDGDFHITSNDGYLLQQYIDRAILSGSFTSTYPGPSTNPYTNIGKTFNVIKFKLEKFIDRTDDYAASPSTRSTTVHTTPDIFVADDGYFATHNFLTYPSLLKVEKKLTWDESLIVTNSNSKSVPSIFTSLTGYFPSLCNLDGVECSVYAAQPDFDPGVVDCFIPNNIIIGESGEIKRPDGEFYKVDFEVGTIVLEIPDGLFGSERTINILDDFISDYTGAGITRLGFPAMKFADCSYVNSNSLANDQLRFSVSVQSFSPNTSGLSNEGYEGAIVDGKIGVSIDYSTGLLTLNFTNLFQDAVLATLSTKIQINVFLKKGGFNNQPLFVNSTKMQNMLSLISVFSGASAGGVSALVDMTSDVTGILPILHGGTGLNAVGPAGTALVSNGSGLTYESLTASGLLALTKEFSLGAADSGKVPMTDGYGLLDPSFYYKNPVYIYGSAGKFSFDGYDGYSGLDGTDGYDGYKYSTIGAFPFRFDKYILEGVSSIKLEVILQTTSSASTAHIKLFNVTTGFNIPIKSGNIYLTTTNTADTYLSSDDIKSLLSSGATDYIYEVRLGLTPGLAATRWARCKMARLVITYNNPSPAIDHSSNFVSYLPSPTPS